MAKLAGFGFVAGDQVSLKKGDVWRETWYVNTGGSTGNPITYNSYGASASKPVSQGPILLLVGVCKVAIFIKQATRHLLVFIFFWKTT